MVTSGLASQLTGECLKGPGFHFARLTMSGGVWVSPASGELSTEDVLKESLLPSGK